MPRQPIALGYAEGRSKPLMAARLVNLYSEEAPQNSRAPGYTSGFSKVNGANIGTPGQKAFTTAGTGTLRAARYALGYSYVLSGAELYRVDSAGTATICTGDTILATGNAMMTDNGVQLTVLSGGQCYVVTGLTISHITAPAYPATGVSSIDTIDGYTIFAAANGASAVYGDPTTITGITAANPPVVSAINAYSDGDQIYISGVVGMTQVNGRSFTIQNVTSANYQLAGIDATAYTAYSSGGTGQKVLAQASGQFFISSLYDSATIDPLDFASAESNSDALVRVLVDHREIWLFGTKSIEPWQDTGASPFPFERISGSVLERGCIAPLSPAKLDNSVFWIGDDRIVYRAQGYQPSRISTNAIEEVLRKAPDISDAYGMTYSMGGHTFYVFTLPTANRTFVYDCATSRWHERQSGISTTPAAWNVQCIWQAWDKIYCGLASGVIAELDLDTFADLGAPIRRVAVTPPFYPDGLWATMSYAEIECELGVGLSTGQGSDPVIMVRWSDDGGATFSNEKRAKMGAMGQRRNRAQVRRLGMFRQRELEFSISDPVKVSLYGMRYEAQVANG